MKTSKNTAVKAVQAAACANPLPRACQGCNQARSPLPDAWQHLDFFDRHALDGQLQFRQDCQKVKAAQKPCLAKQPALQTNASSTSAQAQVLIYRRETLLRILDISKSTLRNWMLEGDFPHPIQLGPRAVGWNAAQVHTWLEARPTVTPGFE